VKRHHGGTAEAKAFSDLKQAISTNYMSYFDKTWNTEICVDTSPVGLGAVLAQANPLCPDERGFVCFASRLLTDTTPLSTHLSFYLYTEFIYTIYP
jgi:hypothetical protein